VKETSEDDGVGLSFVFCTVCSHDVSIAYGGMTQIRLTVL